ncbi:glutamate carboxypeptidase [Noviherbaspirillum galbum]|uniref:M20/M25/M40 family metallo-hydrolase n=1 Tax=Noviherbaspirillum galbum TaxID=2709383 RepID=A0A6B3SQ28_9BURK|nr:glutamate carboxypeptidase [Noviherbaspirillum galbum]NEX63010.1 M20/M25/M40 family metallo-hydrolase [Noviherbaspirillum galbum]
MILRQKAHSFVQRAARKSIIAAALGMALVSMKPALAAADERLLQAARAEQDAVIASLKDMVNIESPSADAQGIARMADYTERRLKELGAKVDRRNSTTGPGQIVIGTLKGTGSKRLMLIAHMDTVYPKGILASQPYRVEGNRIYGPGIADDKGGIAVILHGLKMLNDAGWKDYATITVLFNSDEEVGSVGSGELIANLAAEHDVVFSCEPSAIKPEILLLGAAGTGKVTMQVRGKSAHAGANPELGRNALLEMSHQLIRTQDAAKAVPGTQMNWTMAQAGRVVNQIPESATATADMRLTVSDGFERLERELKERVKTPVIPDTVTEISIERGRPPFVASPASREFAAQGQAVYAEMQRELTLLPMTGGATDAGFAARSGKAIVVESFGLAGAGYHARDEFITVDAIVPRLYLLARMLQQAGLMKTGGPAK